MAIYLGSTAVKLGSATKNETTELVLQSKTVSPSTSLQTVIPDDGYNGLSQVTVNAMPTGTLSTPSISVSSSGVITATSGVSTAGYLSTSASKSGTKSLTTHSGGTYTADSNIQTIASAGTYLTGEIKLNPVPSSGGFEWKPMSFTDSEDEGYYDFAIETESDTMAIVFRYYTSAYSSSWVSEYIMLHPNDSDQIKTLQQSSDIYMHTYNHSWFLTGIENGILYGSCGNEIKDAEYALIPIYSA